MSISPQWQTIRNQQDAQFRELFSIFSKIECSWYQIFIKMWNVHVLIFSRFFRRNTKIYRQSWVCLSQHPVNKLNVHYLLVAGHTLNHGDIILNIISPWLNVRKTFRRLSLTYSERRIYVQFTSYVHGI